MHKDVFMHIVEGVSLVSEYIRSPRYIVVFRMLAYSTPMMH